METRPGSDYYDGGVTNVSEDAFGNIVQQTGTINQPFTYTGREWDAAAGLYYYRARYYDPSVGRFISEDPIGFAGGINFYTYVENNPINNTDPYGLRTVGIGGKLCVDKKCKKDECDRRSGAIPEDLPPDRSQPDLASLPSPGSCMDADFIYTPRGILKIPDHCTCTIRYDASGKPVDISCGGFFCRATRPLTGRFPRLGPQLYPPQPSDPAHPLHGYLPPNPFAPQVGWIVVESKAVLSASREPIVYIIKGRLYE